MKELVATVRMNYGGKRLKPGDRFMATGRHAQLLKAIRRAEDPPPMINRDPWPAVPAWTPGKGHQRRTEEAPSYQVGDRLVIDGDEHTIASVAYKSATDDPLVGADPPKRKRGRPRKYLRRDLTAEQSGEVE